MEEGWGAATTLRRMLLDEAGAPDANDLLHRFYTAEFSRPRIAAFSRLVDEAAERGDEVARGLLDRAARDLNNLVLAVQEQLFQSDEDLAVAYVGGVFRSRTLLARFKELNPHVRPPVYGPGAGALLEAYHSAGLSRVLRQVPDNEK